MSAAVVWLFVFVILYWVYCIYWGVKGARTARTASDYFIAGRSIPLWVFVLAATATSFSGWTFVGHPGLVYRDGFQYAYASFYAITIPFTGLIFLKRQWMLGKRFGYVTPGEMYADYFRSDLMRLLTVLVALIFSVPYLGVQLRASGFLFNVLTNDLFPVWLGMWLLSLVVIIYVASGGLRAVAYVDTVQCVLLAVGIVAVGLITLGYVGGFGALNEGIAQLAEIDTKRTPAGYSHYVAIPGGHPVREVRAERRRRRLDGHHDPHLHVCAHGHPVGAGVLDVVVLQPQPAPLRAAAGVGVVVRHRLHPDRLHGHPGHGGAPAGR